MKKRFLSMLLVLVMVIGMIPFSALSASAASYADAIESIAIMGQNPATIITDVNMAQNGTGSSGGTWTYNPSGVGGVYPTITLNDYNGGAISIEGNDTAERVIVYINVIGECKIESLGTVVELNAPNSNTSQINFLLNEGSSLYLNGTSGVRNNSKGPAVTFNGAGNVTIGANLCAIMAQDLESATKAYGSITVENGTVLKAGAQGTVVSTGYTKNDGNYTNVALNVRNGASVEFTKNGAGTEPVVEGYDAITVPEGYVKNLSADGRVFTLAKPNTLITSATATVDAPIVGNTPDMTAESGNSEQYTVTVKRWNEGFGWYDEISSTTPFEDEEYIVVVTFAPKAGYEFASDAKYYINGVEAEYYEDEGGIWQATFDATQINYIDKVEATVDAPIGGKTPDMTAESGDSSKYSVTVVTWYKDEYPFDTLAETDTFESGKDYGVLLKFTPVAGYEFASNAEYKVNGKNADFLSVEEGCQAYFTAEGAKYNITVTGGTASANKATAGTEITLTVDESAIPAGKVFDKWEVVSGGVTVTDGKFTMPESAVEITATYKDAPVSHTCDIKPVAKDEPSCTEGGKEAYYKCEGCGKFYEDALGAKEITDLANWGNLPKLGHTESDWKSDKDNHWKGCTVTACGVIIEDSKAAHKDDNKDGKCDTCSYAMPKAPSDNETEKPTDATDKPTDATEGEKDDETEAPADNGCGGCGSSAALSALAIVAVVGSALVIKKKTWAEFLAIFKKG